jgi:hypothetical protein
MQQGIQVIALWLEGTNWLRLTAPALAVVHMWCSKIIKPVKDTLSVIWGRPGQRVPPWREASRYKHQEQVPILKCMDGLPRQQLLHRTFIRSHLLVPIAHRYRIPQNNLCV